MPCLGGLWILHEPLKHPMFLKSEENGEEDGSRRRRRIGRRRRRRRKQLKFLFHLRVRVKGGK